MCRRLKKDVRMIEDPLAKVRKLSGMTFAWDKSIPEVSDLDDKRRFGVFAQDVQAVAPELVVPRFEGKYLGVNYIGMIPLLLEAIKELGEVNDEQIKTNVDLRKNNADLGEAVKGLVGANDDQMKSNADLLQRVSDLQTALDTKRALRTVDGGEDIIPLMAPLTQQQPQKLVEQLSLPAWVYVWALMMTLGLMALAVYVVVMLRYAREQGQPTDMVEKVGMDTAVTASSSPSAQVERDI